MKSTTLTILLAGLTLGSVAYAGSEDKKIVLPPAPLEDAWEFKLSLPGWVPWLTTDTSYKGFDSKTTVGPNKYLSKLDMVADIRAEARKGRFSVMGEYYYTGLSDSQSTHTIVKQFDVRLDQTTGNLGMAWSLIKNERGYLDVVGGVRYLNIYQKTERQANDQQIDARVDEIADATRGRLRRLVARVLAPIAGRDVSIPVAPIGAEDIERTARAIEKIQGTREERRARIAERLEKAANRDVSRTDDWWDPYVGFRGRYNINPSFYVTGKADIGGFTVGSDITWSAEVDLGYQISQHVFAELGFRSFGFDYNKDGLEINSAAYGPQITVGTNF